MKRQTKTAKTAGKLLVALVRVPARAADAIEYGSGSPAAWLEEWVAAAYREQFAAYSDDPPGRVDWRKTVRDDARRRRRIPMRARGDGRPEGQGGSRDRGRARRRRVDPATPTPRARPPLPSRRGGRFRLAVAVGAARAPRPGSTGEASRTRCERREDATDARTHGPEVNRCTHGGFAEAQPPPEGPLRPVADPARLRRRRPLDAREGARRRTARQLRPRPARGPFTAARRRARWRGAQRGGWTPTARRAKPAKVGGAHGHDSRGAWA